MTSLDRLQKLVSKFKGKRVLVCGASGMTGRNLYEFMIDLGADVKGTYYSRQSFHRSGMSMIDEPQGKFLWVDFTSKLQTDRLFHEFDFDYVFICCAKTYNAFVCVNDPTSMILPNVNMVGNILDACHRNKVGKVVYVSSATVYQDANYPIAESELDLNQNPHPLYMGVGWMKRYAEKLCEFYAQQGLNVAVVRPTNIYGAFDKVDEDVCHVIPALVMRALKHEPVFKVYGTGKPVKNFIHVDDFVRDLTVVAADARGGSVYNICSDEVVTVASLAHMIQEAVGNKAPVEFLDDHDTFTYRALNRNLFDTTFGKQLYIPLTQGLKDVVEWYSSLHPTVSR